MNNLYLGYIYSVLSAAAFAFTSLFAKWCYARGISAWGFTLGSSVLAVVLLGAVHLVQKEPGPWRVKVAGRDLLLFGMAAATSAIAFNVALVTMSISLSTILLFTYPAFVALEVWLILGRRPRAHHVAALALTLIGAALTTDLREAAAGWTLTGAGLAALAAVAHGLYMTMGEKLGDSLPALSATTLTRMAIATGVLALHPPALGELAGLAGPEWGLIGGAALVAGVAPFLFLKRGIELIGANRAAIASVAELPIALGLGLAFQGEWILPQQWAGALLISAAVVISYRQESRPPA